MSEKLQFHDIALFLMCEKPYKCGIWHMNFVEALMEIAVVWLRQGHDHKRNRKRAVGP
jgi:hypothetical protein